MLYVFRLILHAGDSLVYLLQVLVGYVLMLAVMTYNLYVLAAVIVGKRLPDDRNSLNCRTGRIKYD